MGMWLTGLICLAPSVQEPAPAVSVQVFRAWLDCPGGELPFGLELPGRGAGTVAHLINGVERIGIEGVKWDDKDLSMEIPPYDSAITATVDENGGLTGRWEKRRGDDEWVKMTFHAVPGNQPRFPSLAHGKGGATKTNFTGRWRVQFQHDPHPAVGVFEQLGDGAATGTFLTALGDYRYLAGSAQQGVMRLSCFDGAHAFLFEARAQDDGSLRGNFWSSNTWHETWTAMRDDDAKLPEAFSLTRWRDDVDLRTLRYPDLDGEARSIADFLGPATLIHVFGSWCPNCNDASRYLAELDRRFRGRGLRIVGLAFEHTGDQARNAKVVRQYLRRHGAEYPVLLAGPSDKAAASRALPALDRVRSYPTTVFLDRKGKAVAVHTGFCGPATGADNERLRQRFEELIEGLLAAR